MYFKLKQRKALLQFYWKINLLQIEDRPGPHMRCHYFTSNIFQVAIHHCKMATLENILENKDSS